MYFLKSFLAAVVLFASHATVFADEMDPVAQARMWLAYPDGISARSDPLRYSIEASRKALAGRTDPATPEEWTARVPGLKRALATSLGLEPMPEKTPLNVRITGRAERDFYRVENVVFESRPNFFVTANVYFPRGVALPAPAVVVAAGHSMEHGKNHDLYQLGQLGLVKQGFIVLAFDPIGQGERKRPGFAHDLGYGSLLVGQTNEGIIVWDAIRAVDYLVGREDVDPSRIGLTGNSGGGELVFYAMPFDERIKVGASFCFVCSYDRWLTEGGNHCICNHLPGIAQQMEQFEIIALNAPRAFLAGNGSEDEIFPIAGTRETIRRARALYAMTGSADRIGMVEVPLPHGWSQPLRESAASWMNQWLQGRNSGDSAPEAGIVAEDPASIDILCFKDGKMPDGAETVVTLNRKRADQLIQAYAQPPASADAWKVRAATWRDDVWRVLGGKPEPFQPAARMVHTFEWEGLRVEVLSIEIEAGMEIAAVLARPKEATGLLPASVFVGGHEDKGSAVQSGYAAEAAKAGIVLILDPRATGESARNTNQLTSDGIVLGRPLFAQQLWDLLQAGRWLAGREGVIPGEVTAQGVGDGALLAVYATALDNVFSRVEAKSLLASYRYYLEDEQPQSIALCVPNVLSVIDIPQLIGLAAPTPIRIDGAIGFGKKRLSREAAMADLAHPQAIYAIADAAARLIIE